MEEMQAWESDSLDNVTNCIFGRIILLPKNCRIGLPIELLFSFLLAWVPSLGIAGSCYSSFGHYLGCPLQLRTPCFFCMYLSFHHPLYLYILCRGLNQYASSTLQITPGKLGSPLSISQFFLVAVPLFIISLNRAHTCYPLSLERPVSS